MKDSDLRLELANLMEKYRRWHRGKIEMSEADFNAMNNRIDELRFKLNIEGY